MIPIREAGLVAIAAGLLLGTATDTIPSRHAPKAGDDYILAGDFHVHASLGDGGLAPWELAREARRRGLDVIAVTNHNQVVAAKIAAYAADPEKHAIVIVGQEVTANRFHLIAAGISRRVDWRTTAADTIRAIHDQGGVAIAAHPVRDSWRANEDEALRLLDGAEALHPLARSSRTKGEELVDFHRSSADKNPRLAAIGSSDFHFGATLGLCRTFLFVKEVSERGVLDAIREGRTVAFDGAERFVGDPSLVAMVRAGMDTNLKVETERLSSQVAVWLVLVGLCVVLLFR